MKLNIINKKSMFLIAVILFASVVFAANVPNIKDIDNDGDLDILLNELARNDGVNFTILTLAAGLGDISNISYGFFIDVNNDTYLDIYLVYNGSPNKVFLNNGSTYFTDISSTANATGNSTDPIGANTADFNNDGCIDLFAANKLFLGNCDSTFNETTELANLGPDEIPRLDQVVTGDFNFDDTTDILGVSENKTLIFMLNLDDNNADGVPEFWDATDISLLSNLTSGVSFNSIVAGHFFNHNVSGTMYQSVGLYLARDGPNMLFDTHYSTSVVVPKYLEIPIFRDISAASGTDNPGNSTCAIFMDFDNNTVNDLFVANKEGNNTVYLRANANQSLPIINFTEDTDLGDFRNITNITFCSGAVGSLHLATLSYDVANKGSGDVTSGTFECFGGVTPGEDFGGVGIASSPGYEYTSTSYCVNTPGNLNGIYLAVQNRHPPLIEIIPKINKDPDPYIFINATVTDIYDIDSCWVEWTDNISIDDNITMNMTGVGNNVSCWKNITNNTGPYPDGNYTYRTCANNTEGDLNCTGYNWTIFDNTPPNVTIISPVNGSTHTAGTITFTINVTDNMQTSNVTLIINNSAGVTVYNNTKNASIQTFDPTLSADTYFYSAFGYDIYGKEDTDKGTIVVNPPPVTPPSEGRGRGAPAAPRKPAPPEEIEVILPCECDIETTFSDMVYTAFDTDCSQSNIDNIAPCCNLQDVSLTLSIDTPLYTTFAMNIYNPAVFAGWGSKDIYGIALNTKPEAANVFIGKGGPGEQATPQTSLTQTVNLSKGETIHKGWHINILKPGEYPVEYKIEGLTADGAPIMQVHDSTLTILPKDEFDVYIDVQASGNDALLNMYFNLPPGKAWIEYSLNSQPEPRTPSMLPLELFNIIFKGTKTGFANLDYVNPNETTISFVSYETTVDFLEKYPNLNIKYHASPITEFNYVFTKGGCECYVDPKDPQETTGECRDSDPENDPLIPGQCYDGSLYKIDSCQGEDTIAGWECDNNICKIIVEKCPECKNILEDPCCKDVPVEQIKGPPAFIGETGKRTTRLIAVCGCKVCDVNFIPPGDEYIDYCSKAKPPVERAPAPVPEEYITVAPPSEYIEVIPPSETITPAPPSETITPAPPSEYITVASPPENIVIAPPNQNIFIAPQRKAAGAGGCFVGGVEQDTDMHCLMNYCECEDGRILVNGDYIEIGCMYNCNWLDDNDITQCEHEARKRCENRCNGPVKKVNTTCEFCGCSDTPIYNMRPLAKGIISPPAPAPPPAKPKPVPPPPPPPPTPSKRKPIPNATIEVVTIKDVYNTGEKVELTDPPSNNNYITGKIISNEILPESPVTETRLMQEEQEVSALFDETGLVLEYGQPEEFAEPSGFKSRGYIFQLTENSLVEEQTKYAIIANENQEYFDAQPWWYLWKYPWALFATMPDDVPEKVAKQAEKIDSEQERVLQDIRGIVPITGSAVAEQAVKRFKNTFNGFVLTDITSEEAALLKERLPDIKVTPDFEVQALLTESIPLINADDVWQMTDSQGRPLTGKGVTIAIIDTGIDPYHPDLGSTPVTERDFEKITDTELDLWKWPDIDQQISMDNNRLAYYSGNKLYIYSFETGQTTEINAFSGELEIMRLFLKDNLLAYFATTWPDMDNGIYLYNLDTGAHKRIPAGLIEEIGLMSISNNKVIYGKAIYIEEQDRFDIHIYLYDALTEELTAIGEDTDSLYMPLASGNNIAYSVPAPRCYEKIMIYNMETGQEREITPPDVGPIVDFEGDKLLYVACSKTNFDRMWRTHYLYDINTGEYLKLTAPAAEGGEGNKSNILGFVSIRSIINKGAIGKDVILFSKDVNANKIMAYDQNQDKYVQINLHKISGTIDAENNKVCFIASDYNIYCHDYDPASSYDIPESSAFNQKVIGGYDIVNQDNDPTDDQGHGTHCAATAAGNGILKGVAPDAKLYAYKVLDSWGSGSFSGVIEGIERAVDPNQDGDFSDRADVISLSLGGVGDPDDPVSQAIDNAVDAGTVAVIAAGNSGPFPETISSPGTARKAITVGAADKNKDMAVFSSRGPVIWENNIIIKPDIAAPGVDICAAQWDDAWPDRECFDDRHVAISGTSMATPHVAGAAALLKQMNPDFSPAEIKSILKNSAEDIGESVLDQGHGLIDMFNAAQIKSPVVVYLETNGLLKGTSEVKGEIITKIPVTYALEYGPSFASSVWTQFYEDTIRKETQLDLPIDTTAFEDGKYSFRLTATDDLGMSYQDTALIKINNNPYFNTIDKKKGFSAAWVGFVVGDVNNDGTNEIIGTESIKDNMLWVWDKDGRVMDGWPREIDYWYFFGSFIIPAPALADIDNDGMNEIVLVSGAHVHAFNHDGSDVNGFPIDIDTEGTMGHHARFPQFSVGDLDNDNQDEIISILSDIWENNTPLTGMLYVFSSQGEILTKKHLNGIPNSAPAIGDVNNDGINEAVIGLINCNEEGTHCGSTEGAKLTVVDKKGNALPGWPAIIPESYLVRSPVLGDIDGDNELEIIINVAKNTMPVKLSVLVFDGFGNMEKEIILNQRPVEWYDVSLADINNDNLPEIIARNDEEIKIFDKDGNIMAENQIISTNPHFSVVGNIDDNEDKEILVWNRDELIVLDSKLNIKDKMFINSFGGIGSVALTDLENNNKLDIVGVSNDGEVFAWKNIADYDEDSLEWPMFMYDTQHRACYKCYMPVIPPKSMINNTGKIDLNGRLLIKIQKKTEQIEIKK